MTIKKVVGNIVEDIEHFYVTEWAGRNYLYSFPDKRLAECVNGDYQERFGGIHGWLKHVKKRSEKRLKKINEIRGELSQEEDVLEMTLLKINFWGGLE